MAACDVGAAAAQLGCWETSRSEEVCRLRLLSERTLCSSLGSEASSIGRKRHAIAKRASRALACRDRGEGIVGRVCGGVGRGLRRPRGGLRLAGCCFLVWFVLGSHSPDSLV